MGLFNRKKSEPQQVIDLRDPTPSKPKWGSPVPCPDCGGRGYLDHIDPYRDLMHLHCIECLARYDVSRADMTPQLRSRPISF